MAKHMPKRNLERVGQGVTGACVALVTLLVVALIFMVAQKGLSTFFKDGVDVIGFFTGTNWSLAHVDEATGLPQTGALPLIVTSFAVTLLSTAIALPIAIGSAIFAVEIAPNFGKRIFQPMIELLVGIVTSFAVTLLSTAIALPIAIGSAIFAVEIAPNFGKRIFQPMIELLVGIPSVVFGLIGFHVVVAACKAVFGTQTGMGILPGAIVLSVMILPTVTTLSMDALRAVPDGYRQGSLALGYTRWQTIRHVVIKSAMPSLMLPTVTTLSMDALRAVPDGYRQGSLALGYTRWQTIRHVVIKSAMPSLMTAVILGMTRAFGETLAVRMVIGGAEVMPLSLLSPPHDGRHPRHDPRLRRDARRSHGHRRR